MLFIPKRIKWRWWCSWMDMDVGKWWQEILYAKYWQYIHSLFIQFTSCILYVCISWRISNSIPMMFKSICNFLAVCFCKDFDRSVYCFCLANVFLDTFYWHYWWWYACVRGICCMRSGVIRSAWWDDRLREREREKECWFIWSFD